MVLFLNSWHGLFIMCLGVYYIFITQKAQISDEPIVSLPANSGDFRIDSTHRARVVGYSMVDGLLRLSLRESVLKQAFLRHEDVQVGQVVEACFSLTNSKLWLRCN